MRPRGDEAAGLAPPFARGRARHLISARPGGPGAAGWRAFDRHAASDRHRPRDAASRHRYPRAPLSAASSDAAVRAAPGWACAARSTLLDQNLGPDEPHAPVARAQHVLRCRRGHRRSNGMVVLVAAGPAFLATGHRRAPRNPGFPPGRGARDVGDRAGIAGSSAIRSSPVAPVIRKNGRFSGASSAASISPSAARSRQPRHDPNIRDGGRDPPGHGRLSGQAAGLRRKARLESPSSRPSATDEFVHRVVLDRPGGRRQSGGRYRPGLRQCPRRGLARRASAPSGSGSACRRCADRARAPWGSWSSSSGARWRFCRSSKRRAAAAIAAALVGEAANLDRSRDQELAEGAFARHRSGDQRQAGSPRGRSQTLKAARATVELHHRAPDLLQGVVPRRAGSMSAPSPPRVTRALRGAGGRSQGVAGDRGGARRRDHGARRSVAGSRGHLQSRRQCPRAWPEAVGIDW